VGKLRTIAQEAIGVLKGHNFLLEGFLRFKPGFVMSKVKVKPGCEIQSLR
jgi:hypothetical protein